MSRSPLRPALLLAGILLLAANMRDALTVVSPLSEQIRSELQLNSLTVSALISLPLLCFAAVSPLVPKFAARWGIERTLTGGLVVLIAGIALRSAPWVPALWIGTLLVGASIACINVLLPALLKRDFPERIGSLTGAYNAVQSATAGLAASLAVPLARMPGWGWRAAIGSTVALAIIALAVMLPQAVRARPARPERTPVAPGEPAHPEAPAARPLWRQATAWHVTLFMGLQSSLFYSVLMWWPAVETAEGVSPATAGLHVAVVQVAGVVGSLTAGALLKRVRPLVITVAPVLLTAAGLLGQLLWPGGGVLWAIVLGLGTGGNIVVVLALFGARTRTHHRAAALSGMAQSFGYLLAACVPPLLGLVHDATGSWAASLWLLLALALAAAAFAGLGARRRVVE